MPRQRDKQVSSPAPPAEAGNSVLDLQGLSLARSYEGIPASSYCIDWSPDGTFLAARYGIPSRGGDGKTVIWSAVTGQRHILPGATKALGLIGLAWHPVQSVL